MKKNLFLFLLVLVSMFNLAFAGPLTKDDLVKFVEKAAEVAKKEGKDNAIKLFMDKENKDFFIKEKNLYIFAYTNDGINLALPTKPALQGKNLWDLKDTDGTPLIQNMANVGKSGKGFVKYNFENPATKKIEKKISYVIGVGDYWLGSGLYESECPECFK